MEVIRRKVLLEHGISRIPDAGYGSMTADSFYIKVMFSQDADDMGTQFVDSNYQWVNIPIYARHNTEYSKYW
jgi:hypothetical protein